MIAGSTVKVRGRAEWAPAALVAAALLAPGAWMLTRLPPVPVAKALTLLTAAAWLLAAGLGAVGLMRLDRRVAIALGSLGGVVIASAMTAGWVFEAAFYDLYADMPLVQWLAFLAVFAIAACLRTGAAPLRRALGAAVVVGTVLAAVAVIQQVTIAHVWVFGSTGYNVTVLAALVPVACGLAGSAESATARAGWYGATAVVLVTLAVFLGTTMGTIAAVFAAVVSVAAHPALHVAGAGWRTVVRRVAAVMAVAMLGGALVATVPALGGRWVNPESVSAFDKNVVGRVYMWQGAQAMVAERPLLGFGPAGYRMSAAEYLAPEALQFGSDRPGDIDPAVYSPQSPHSLVWDVGTRLGLAGVAAFVGLFLAWALALRDRRRDADEIRSLRLPLAGGFVTGLFSLTVNPPLFAIGLFLPAAAGLAIAPARSASTDGEAAGFAARRAAAVIGVVLAIVAGWLVVGEWRAYTMDAQDPVAALVDARGVLTVLPGHPVSTRRVLEMELLMAPDDAAVRVAQQAADTAPGHIAGFAPNLVSLATHSLAQAERTGRADLTWERGMLDRAAAVLPPTPALVAEQLHLAVLSGDRAAVAAALPDAREWGTPYPFTAAYLERAEALLEP